jgi:hypothetical protein
VSISRAERLGGFAALLAVLGVTLAHCVSPTNCLRYSDCDEGLTCAYGRCVVPMPPSDGGGTEGATGLVAPAEGGGTTGADSAGPSTHADTSTGDAPGEAEGGASEASPDATAD